MDLVATYVGNERASGRQDTAAAAPQRQRHDAPGGNAVAPTKARGTTLLSLTRNKAATELYQCHPKHAKPLCVVSNQC